MNKNAMAKRTLATVLLIGLLAAGVAACGSSTPKKAASSTATSTGNKTAFCNAQIAIDKAFSVTTFAGYLTVAKSHQSDLTAVRNDGPAPIRSQAQGLVTLTEKAIADNNPNELITSAGASDAAAVDTFCGVDGNGNPVPSYFGAGKGTAFCSVSNQINKATSTATPPQILSFLLAHQNLANEYATDLSALPAKQKAEAQQLATISRTAISSNNPAGLGSTTANNDSADINLYCGQNQ